MKLFFCLFVFVAPLAALEEGELDWTPQGPSVQEYNGLMQQALKEGNWWAVIDYAGIISYNFPTSPFASEVSYIMGEAYYRLEQLEAANDCFTAYLNHVASPKNFEQAIEYKFRIAERFATGTKKRLFSSVKMPAWVPAQEDAIPIYDEVIASLPHSDMAAKALLGKARVQAYAEDFKPSEETLDLLIRRFPKHELAAEAYLEKNKVYLEQCKLTSFDLDILDLAEVSLRKFRLTHPRDSRLEEAEKVFLEMQELYAQNLYETGCFFAKTGKEAAALIYFQKVMAQYPATEAALLSREKMDSVSQ
jgi:outer membrane protein assembly factor BamD (BamD/ComL family)